MQAFLCFLICFSGGIIQTGTGFGLSIWGMAFLPFFMPFKSATVLMTICTFAMGLQALYKYRRQINFRLILFPTAFAIVGRSAGFYLLNYVNADLLRIILGATFVVFSVYFAFYSDRLRIRPTPVNGTITGLLSGVLGGMFNTGGPPMVVYFLSCTKDKNEYNMAMQISTIITVSYSLLLQVMGGSVSGEVLSVSVYAIIGVTIGAYLGFLLFDKINRALLSKIIYIFLAIMGCTLLVSGFRAIA